MANYVYTTNGELKHWGVKGMKWGVRRYQNKDGSLTPAGDKRYARDVRENNAKKKDNRININGPDPKRWAQEDLKRTKGVVDSSKDMVKELKNIDNNIKPKSKAPKMDLSKMSDQEMRSKINRAILEKQYADMFAPQKTSKGREYATQILETTGTVLAIGGSALGIALAIKELRG